MTNKNVLTLAIPSLLIAALLWAPLASSQVWINGQHANGSHAHHHHFMENLLPSSYHHIAKDDFHYNKYTNSLAPVIAQSMLPMLIVAPLQGPMSYFEISHGNTPPPFSKQLITILYAIATFGVLLRPQNTPFPDLQPPK